MRHSSALDPGPKAPDEKMAAIVLKPHDFNSTKRKLIFAPDISACTNTVQAPFQSGALSVWNPKGNG